MEGLLLTFGLVGLMLVALIVLGRSWPRSSRLGGYRARRSDGSASSDASEQERGAAIREDDHTRWDWGADADDRPGQP